MISLHHEMIYTLDVEGPLEGSDDAAGARHQWWQMTRATLVGSRIHASTPMPGIDWFAPDRDGFGRPHVRLPLRTDDGAVILLEYRGVVQATAAFTTAVAADRPTEWGDQYMRMALLFETTAGRYRWLTQSLFVARGRLAGAKQIEYDVYRVE